MIPAGSHVIVVMFNKKFSDPSGVVHKMYYSIRQKINVYDPAGVDAQ